MKEKTSLEKSDNFPEIYDKIRDRADQRLSFTDRDYFRTVERDNKLVAVISAERTGERLNLKYPYIDKPLLGVLFVLEDYRGQGIGTRLVNQLARDLDTDIIVADYINPDFRDDDIGEFYEKVEPEVVNLRDYRPSH